MVWCGVVRWHIVLSYSATSRVMLWITYHYDVMWCYVMWCDDSLNNWCHLMLFWRKARMNDVTTHNTHHETTHMKMHQFYLKSVMFGSMVTGRPISSRKNRCVGILHACKHVLAQPAVSKKRHFSTSSPCALLVTTWPDSFENSTASKDVKRHQKT